MKKQNNLYLFILAGGSGERFWPLSREKCPKHLLSLFSKKTLLEETIQRVKTLVPAQNLFILTNIHQKKLIQKKLRSFPVKQIIVEPEKRDTAPAAALATALALQKNPHAVVGLLPADHFIKQTALFQKNIYLASQIAAQGEALITLGIPPTFPATGFGYLKLNAKTIKPGSAYSVTEFLEKPNQKRAAKFLKQKNYYWNAGLFFWRADYFLQETQRLAPELARFIQNFPHKNNQSYLKKQFPLLTKISLDYAFAEKTKQVRAIVAEFDWNDVGSWDALTHYFPVDSNNNTLIGPSMALDSSDNIVLTQSQHLVLHHVKDLIVVVTKDAILISHRSQNQTIKKIMSRLPINLR